MKYVALLLLLLVCTPGIAQKKNKHCKYDRFEIDDMTGVAVKETKYKTLFSKTLAQYYLIHVKAIEIDSIKLLEFKIHKQSAFSVPEDARIILKDSEGETYTLYSIDYYLADGHIGRYSSSWQVRAKYIVDDALFDQLLWKRIIKIRVYFSDGYHDYDINEGNQQVIRNLLFCLK